MRTTVHVKAPAFEGHFTRTVETDEWKGFVQTLRHLEASVGKETQASWANMESQYRISIHAPHARDLGRNIHIQAGEFQSWPYAFGRL